MAIILSTSASADLMQKRCCARHAQVFFWGSVKFSKWVKSGPWNYDEIYEMELHAEPLGSKLRTICRERKTANHRTLRHLLNHYDFTVGFHKKFLEMS